MADTTQRPKDVSTLAKKLDGSNAQKAEAIAEFVDGRIKVAIEKLEPRLQQIAQEHRQNVAAANNLPTAQREEVKDDVNDAGKEVRAAQGEASDLAARHDAGEKVGDDEVRRADEHADKAESKVQRAKQSVDERVDRHEAILAVNHDGKRPPSRLDAIEQDVQDLKSWKGSANERIESAQSTASRALSIASNSATSDSALRRGSAWAIGTFGLVFLLYLVIWGLSGSLEHTWRDQFAWPFGLAAVAFWLGIFTAKNQSNQKSGSDDAHHKKNDRHEGDGGLDVVRSNKDDQHAASAR